MYNNYYQQQPMGTMYYNQMKPPQMTQPLTPEEIKALQSQNVSFSMKLDPKELIASKCTHKQGDQIKLIPKGDDSVTCAICGETFRLMTDDTIDVNSIVENAVDLIQSIKTLYLDMPMEYAQHVPTVIPFLRKLPQLYKIALNNYRKYEDAGMLKQVQPYYNNTSAMYNSLIAGNYNMQPIGMMQQSQPMYNPNYINPQAQMCMDPTMQGFMQPMQQPMPMMQNYAQNNFGQSPFQQAVPGYNPVNMPGAVQQPVVQPQQPQPAAQPQPQPQQPAQTAATTTNNAQPNEVQQQKIFQV